MPKKLLILTGGGDCPGLNAVIRGVSKRARHEKDWTVYGSIEAFNGVLKEPNQIVEITNQMAAGIHVKGGTILKTTNKDNPINFPVLQADGTTIFEDRSDELVSRLNSLGFDAVINIGGDGSQRISKVLYEKGVNIIGVPKTIDNDLGATDTTFGFQTAVQIATDSFDKLVTTAESHHRVMIMEVMGRVRGGSRCTAPSQEALRFVLFRRSLTTSTKWWPGLLRVIQKVKGLPTSLLRKAHMHCHRVLPRRPATKDRNT